MMIGITAIETLPVEIKKDLATIRELDKKCASEYYPVLNHEFNN